MIPSTPKLQNGLAAANEVLLSSSWHQFNAQFPSEEDCVEELYKRLHKNSATCRHCRCRNIRRAYGSRTMRCVSCNRKTWLTAGTFFNRTRSTRPWLAAIWLLEKGVSLSSFRFAKLLGIAYASALTIFKKITLVVHSQMGTDALSVSSAHFAPLFCKRSRETPAREHPVAEQENSARKIIENAIAVAGPSSDNKSNNAIGQVSTETATRTSELSKPEAEILKVLSDQPAHFDSLCQSTGRRAGELSAILVMLELAGLAKRMPGDQYVRSKDEKLNNNPIQTINSRAALPKIFTQSVADIIGFVRANFHGISRKYLQNYLAAYWCYADRMRWTPGCLLKRCLQFRIVTCDEILSFVSPSMINVPVIRV